MPVDQVHGWQQISPEAVITGFKKLCLMKWMGIVKTLKLN
jgi:hypothetical protein